MGKSIFRFVGYYLTPWYNEKREVEVEYAFANASRFIKNGQLTRDISCKATVVGSSKKIKIFADQGTFVMLIKDD